MANTNVKKTFPIGITIGMMVALVVAAFIGAFGISYLKNRVIDPSADPSSFYKRLGLFNRNLGGTGEGEGTGTGGGTGGKEIITPSEDVDLKNCKKGTFSENPDTKLTVTGKEKISFEKENAEACCYETENFSEGELSSVTKTCMFIDQPDSTVIYYKVNGKFAIWGAVISKNGEQCNYIYNMETGELESKTCI